MSNKVIREGDSGAHVSRVQEHLNGAGFNCGAVDGRFGPRTTQAVKAYQLARDLRVDGLVGEKTIEALLSETQRVPTVTESAKPVTPIKLPPVGEKLVPYSTADMKRVLGKFAYTVNRDGTISRDPEWERQHLETVFVPQLRGVVGPDGRPFGGKVRVHRSFSGPLMHALEAIEACGLLHFVLTFDGADCPRLVRGGSGLSNHAFGAALDINCEDNGLGHRPAETGKRGSVRELVPIFAAYGIGWGGWWDRPDGMHFGLGRAL